MIGYNEQADAFSYAHVNPFGPAWHTPHDATMDAKTVEGLEKQRFTKAWPELRITVDNDMIGHPAFPGDLRAAGYPVGPAASGEVPIFRKPAHGDPEGLRLRNEMEAAPVVFEMPDGGKKRSFAEGEPALAVGAWQGNRLFALEEPLFVQNWQNPAVDSET